VRCSRRLLLAGLWLSILAGHMPGDALNTVGRLLERSIRIAERRGTRSDIYYLGVYIMRDVALRVCMPGDPRLPLLLLLLAIACAAAAIGHGR
jgi:hypothetical protein